MGTQDGELSGLAATQTTPATPATTTAFRVPLVETDEADDWGVSPNFADTRENLLAHGVNPDLLIQKSA